jgi:hypothetical protein
MNNLWMIRSDADRYRSFAKKKPITGQKFISLVDIFRSGEPIGERWEPIELGLFPGEEGKEAQEQVRPIPDFTRGVVVYAISAKARSILEPLIADQVEFLLLKTDVGLFYDMNIKRVDCLDVSRSVVIRFKSSGRVMDIEKYAFLWERIEGIHIFCIPELGATPIFVSDAFKKTVEENHLTGFVFMPVPLAMTEDK